VNIGNVKGWIVAKEKDDFVFRAQHPTDRELPSKVVVPVTFQSSVQDAIIGNLVALIDVTIDHSAHCLLPTMVIIEPDYLLDVSVIAECMREYGSHPFYFLLSRSSEKSNTAPMLLGNAANFFLDELVFANKIDDVDANATVKKYFHLYPVEISACKDLRERSTELQFFESLKLHFNNLKTVVKSTFQQKGIKRKSAILEPSFICPNIGLQGRLDFFEQKENGTSSVIELKSGKTPFGDHTDQAIGLNHQAQASLYQMMIQQVLGIAFSRLQTYICYSRCSTEKNPLRLAHPSMALISEALNIRNHIALNDYKVAFKHIVPQLLFTNIEPERMVKDDFMDTKLIHQYIAPQINHFAHIIQNATELEQAYFFAYYQFLVKEQWLSKCGTPESVDRSLAALWTLDALQKKESGTMLEGLRMVDKQIQYGYTVVRFLYSEDHGRVADFREGDIVVLYPKMTEKDNVTTHQVFKGSILSLSESNIVLRLRNHQQDNVLSDQHAYAIEHDVLDHNFTAQFRGLYKFLSAPKARRELVLGLRKPIVKTKKLQADLLQYTPETQLLLQKTNNSQELFLLVGPPGTGKTSIALKAIVDYNYKYSEDCILLCAYTNRAVDEICMAIEKIEPCIDYVRLGSHINCPQDFQKSLLSEQVKRCGNRRDVQNFIREKRVYIGTVSALSANTELLANKHFGIAIVDEASQILDPQLLNLFCSQNSKTQFSIGKFVLIGDHKQLPAVCLQDDGDFENPLLLEKNIVSGKVSFFERMYRLYYNDSNIVAQLNRQGRMHPEIAQFANDYFYSSSLMTVPLPHQEADLHWVSQNYSDYKKYLSQYRNYFFPISDFNMMSAKKEAEIVADIVKSIFELYSEHGLDFHPQYSLGIITPFRSQIALIRKRLRDLDIPAFSHIVVDTVERYQGSQKDIIVYAFGVYHPKQLQQVTDAVTVLDDVTVDRKLNVALTRARKQFFFVGNEYWVQQNELYRALVQHLRK